MEWKVCAFFYFVSETVEKNETFDLNWKPGIVSAYIERELRGRLFGKTRHLLHQTGGREGREWRGRLIVGEGLIGRRVLDWFFADIEFVSW